MFEKPETLEKPAILDAEEVRNQARGSDGPGSRYIKRPQASRD